MPYKPGFEEEGFLKSLAPFDVKEIELLANECTEVQKHPILLFSN
jgi:beta-1,3-glucuronyltransferase P